MLINRVNIVGNLTKDPEIKETPSGKIVSNLSIAHNHSYFKKNEKVNKVSYFDVEYWGNLLEKKSEHLTKGRSVAVEGRLIQDRWEKDGKTQSRIKIVADVIQYLPKKKDGTSEGGNPTPIDEIVTGVCEGMTNGVSYEE